MNTLYLMPDGGLLYAPDKALPQSVARMIREDLKTLRSAPPGLLVLGEPVTVVDLRAPEPTEGVVEVDAATRIAALGFPDYDYLPS